MMRDAFSVLRVAWAVVASRGNPMTRKIVALNCLLAALTVSMQGQDGKAVPLRMTSPAFTDGQPIPSKYTCDGQDVSPPLRWDNPTSNAKTFALICDDPDAPGGTWVHWVIYNIPASTTSLSEGVKKTPAMINNIFQGHNDFGKSGYNGPCPPGGKAHRYFFKVYALDASFSPPRTLQPKKSDLVKAMEGHIVAEGSLMGTYQRQ
jgi:Raf kinase inhibitor-like YbhB/YbcL family protein